MGGYVLALALLQLAQAQALLGVVEPGGLQGRCLALGGAYAALKLALLLLCLVSLLALLVAAIWVALSNGYSSDAIDAARSAGAMGGTILKGRRQNSERISRKLGISMQEEEEFVIIVTPREKKAAVMNAISDACGLRTDAHGIILSLPVDEVIGLETGENTL